MTGRSVRAAMAMLAVCGGLTLGCKTRKARAPAAPAALVAVAAAEPLSAPQTAVQLPPPQPVPPEAAPPEQGPPAEKQALPPEPKPVRRTRPGPLAPAASPPATAAPPAARGAGEGGGGGPQLRPLLSAAQEQEYRRQIEQNLAAARRSLARVRPQRLGKDRAEAAERVRAFIQQAEDARREGDLVRARSLAERAQLLASDLAQISK